MQGLRRIYLFVSVKLPAEVDLLHDPEPPPDCDSWGREYHGRKTPVLQPIHRDVCKNFMGMYKTLMTKVYMLKHNITRKIRTTLPFLLPNEILRTSQGSVVKLPNGVFWHGSNFEKNISRRAKRIPIPAIFAGINMIGGLAIKGVNAFINYKRNKAMSKAVEQLYKNDKMFHDKLLSMEHRQAVIAKTMNTRFRNIRSKIQRQDRRIDKGLLMLQQFINYTHHEFARTYEAINNHHMAIKFLSRTFSYYATALHEHIDYYQIYDRMLDGFLTGLDTLAEGILSFNILDPTKLYQYLRTIEKNVLDSSNFDLAFQHTYQYYAEPLISFTNSPDELILQIPILIKRKTQVPMSLFSINTAPVPMDDATYQGKNNEYTWINVNHPYLATTSKTYIPLTEQQLRLCTKLGPTYYCENAHLIRDRSDHTCASAIFYDAGSDAIVKTCEPKYIKSSLLKPIVLDAGELMVLSNLPSPWALVCEPNHRPIPIIASTYRILNRSELCQCSLSAGAYFLGQTKQACDDTEQAMDGIFQTYYTFNHIIFDILKTNYNIEPEHSVQSIMDTLLSDIPVYSWMTFPWYQPDEEDRQDIVDNWNEDQIEAELEQMIDILVDETYDSIYKSMADFEQAQKNFLKYFKEAQFWEKMATIGSILSWINIVLWFVILFFSRNIIKRIIASLPIMQQYELVKIADAQVTKKYSPIFTMPPPPIEAQDMAPAKTAISSLSVILILITILGVLYTLYKKFQYKSSLFRVCFPLYPLAKYVRGSFHSDIFVEITKINTAQTIWAHMAYVAEYPSQLKVTGTLTIDDIRIHKVCCLYKLHVNWRNVKITKLDGTPVKLPYTGAVSVFTPTTLTFIDKSEQYNIRILGRVLDHIMVLQGTALPENDITPRAHGTDESVHERMTPTVFYDKNTDSVRVEM